MGDNLSPARAGRGLILFFMVHTWRASGRPHPSRSGERTAVTSARLDGGEAP